MGFRMGLRPRLVPAVMVAATALLGVKVTDIWLALDTSAIATAWAAGGEEARPAQGAAAPASAPIYGKTQVPDVPTGGAKPEDAARDPLLMSPAEIGLLKQLSERRSELDKRAAALAQREVLLQAAEKRIDEKIGKLQSIEKHIDGVVQKQDDENDARVKSLVRIYERMKPRDAARIFEQLDMPVLLSVLENMRELKAAPILASMDPAKAKAVTLALAERRSAKVPPAASEQTRTPPKP